MTTREETFDTCNIIFEYLKTRNYPIFYEDLARNSGINPSVEGERKRLSDSLNLLKKDGLIEEVVTGAYSLLPK